MSNSAGHGNVVQILEIVHRLENQTSKILELLERSQEQNIQKCSCHEIRKIISEEIKNMPKPTMDFHSGIDYSHMDWPPMSSVPSDYLLNKQLSPPDPKGKSIIPFRSKK